MVIDKLKTPPDVWDGGVTLTGIENGISRVQILTQVLFITTVMLL